jgi:hypothetical protein
MSEKQEANTSSDSRVEESSSLEPVTATDPVVQSGTAVVAAGTNAVSQFPLTDKADKVKPPLTLEEKRKVWIRRIIGAILFFSILGCLALLAAAQAVTFLFKTILSP